MTKKPLKFLFAFIFALMTCLCVNAQTSDASTSNGRPDPNKFNDLPDPIKETLAKQRIKNEEKEYQELLKRGEDAAKLSAELNKSLESTQNLTTEDIKKLERLEKLVKKIQNQRFDEVTLLIGCRDLIWRFFILKFP